MFSWEKALAHAWRAFIEPPDPNSLGEKLKRAHETYEEIGDAAELVSALLPPPKQEKEKDQ